jgi:AcrR family transcriptional regulator
MTAKTKSASDTKARILETALGLFNQHGAAEVTTNHIAAQLNMSPGNLYYHHRNKEEIIRALFDQFDAASDALFTLPSDDAPTLEDFESLIEGNFALQWRYRFLFRDLLGLLRRDAKLEDAYQRQRQRGLTGTRELIVLFSNSGVIAAAQSERDLEEITRLVWMLSDFWLPSLELGREAAIPERFAQGVSLLRRLLRPLLLLEPAQPIP